MAKSAASQTNFVHLISFLAFIALLIISFVCNNSTKNSPLATEPWTKHIIDENLVGASNVFVANIDGDSDLDIIASGHFADDVVWYEAPSWNKNYIDEELKGAHSVLVSDMNNDGAPDIVAAAAKANIVVWYKQNR